MALDEAILPLLQWNHLPSEVLARVADATRRNMEQALQSTSPAELARWHLFRLLDWALRTHRIDGENLFAILAEEELRQDPAVLKWLARPGPAESLRSYIYKEELIDLAEWAGEAAARGNTRFMAWLADFADERELTGFDLEFWNAVVSETRNEATWDWYEQRFGL